MPFSKSKSTALSVLEAQEEVKRQTKEEQKRKRQKKETILREQKEEKMKRLELLASKRLPEEVVETLSAKPSRQSDNSKRKKGSEIQRNAKTHTSNTFFK